MTPKTPSRGSAPAATWLTGGFMAVSLLAAASCTPVAPYERVQLNDADMKLTARTTETFEHNVEAYREGASGANGGKIGGGCGCN